MNVDLRHAMADHRQVEGFGHAGDLEPGGDPARAHLVDHHDIDRAGLHHVAERHDPVEVFAAGYRCRQRRRYPCEPGVIVMRRHVFEPEEADPGILDAAADVDRLFGPPALVDVAHQIHVGADRLADQASLLDFARWRGHAREAQLHLGLAVALLAQPSGGGQRLVELEAAPERAARIGRDPVAPAAQQLPQRQAERLPLQIPQRDVDRRHRQRQDAGRAGLAGRIAQLLGDRLDSQRVLADRKRAQFVDRMA